jgi:carboxynorspermidine decarboxylase
MQPEERFEFLKTADLRTPAFVFDVGALRADAQRAREAVCDADTQLLFAIKSYSVAAGLQHIASEVAGFATSSLFEARLAREILKPQQSVHLTTPGLRPDEILPICELADYLSFNSLTQWLRFRDVAAGRLSCGLRVNPQLSLVSDVRYDPCRHNSKLGVSLDELRRLLHEAPEQLDGIRGIHVHSNCDSADLTPLLMTVERLLEGLGPLFDRIEWVNLGGGYLFHDPLNTGALAQAKARLQARGRYRVFMEPGASIVRRAGQIVASVVDLFASGGRQLAVLDTSVNHMPEVFEYQFEPDVAGDSASAEYEYLLAGASCVAGDLFGSYGFVEPLRVGTRIVFPDMGAYAMVKANMFNGINLPTIYALGEAGELAEIKRFGYADFLTLCGA